MSIYRFIDEFGKKGVAVLENESSKQIRFYFHSEIAISINQPQLKIDESQIPAFERSEHYRASQLYFFSRKTKDISDRTGIPIEQTDITSSSLEWEKQFRFLYHKKFIENH